VRSNPHLTVGEIIRRYGTAFLEAYGDSISYRQKKDPAEFERVPDPFSGRSRVPLR
jgi:hypothetical protein